MTDVITKVAIGWVEYPFAGWSATDVAAEDVSYDNTTSGMTADNVQDAMDEVFQSVSNGKELIADAITDKGVSTSATDSFQTMASNIESLTVWGKYSEWSVGDVLHFSNTSSWQTICYSSAQTENGDTVYYYGTGFKRTSLTWDFTLVKYNDTNGKMFVVNFAWTWNSWSSGTRFKFYKDWDKVWFADTYWSTILFWYFDSTNQFVQESTWADTSNNITQFWAALNNDNSYHIEATLWSRSFRSRDSSSSTWPKIFYVM